MPEKEGWEIMGERWIAAALLALALVGTCAVPPLAEAAKDRGRGAAEAASGETVPGEAVLGETAPGEAAPDEAAAEASWRRPPGPPGAWWTCGRRR